MKTNRYALTCAALLALFVTPGAVAQAPHALAEAPPPAAAAPLFATVNGKPITAQEYDQTARETFRNKFYHGKPPETEVNQMLKGVGQDLIDRILLAEEVARLKVAPDTEDVDKELAGYEKRYGQSPMWQQQREQTLPRLREHLTEKSRLKQLERQVRESVKLSEQEIRAYYDKNPESFTEPEKVKLSMILLRVDPSSSSEVWAAAFEEGKRVHKQLTDGADFAAIARDRSGDKSASKGGDMGYLHRGMLSASIETQLDTLKTGAIGEPIQTLEGIAIVRLEDRITAKLRAFPEVKERAGNLLLRERGETAWKAHLEKLRKDAKIEIAPAFQTIMSTN